MSINERHSLLDHTTQSADGRAQIQYMVRSRHVSDSVRKAKASPNRQRLQRARTCAPEQSNLAMAKGVHACAVHGSVFGHVWADQARGTAAGTACPRVETCTLATASALASSSTPAAADSAAALCAAAAWVRACAYAAVALAGRPRHPSPLACSAGPRAAVAECGRMYAPYGAPGQGRAGAGVGFWSKAACSCSYSGGGARRGAPPGRQCGRSASSPRCGGGEV